MQTIKKFNFFKTLNRVQELLLDTIGLLRIQKPNSSLKEHLRAVAKYFFLGIKNITNERPIFLDFDTNLSKNKIWWFFSNQLGFTLKHINVRDYLNTPVVLKTTNGVEQMPDRLFNSSTNSLLQIRVVSELLNKNYSSFRVEKWEHWLSRYQLTNDRLLKNAGITNAKLSSLSTLEIGAGIGVNSLVESLMVEQGVVNINYDLPGMLSLQRNIRDFLVLEEQNEELFNNIKYTSNYEELLTLLSNNEYKILTYWAFTEFPLEEREKFEKVFKGAKYAIVVANRLFDDVDNFDYIHKLAKRINKDLYETHVENPANLGYVKNHKAFLLV